jgi:hypothetical protein
MAQNRRKAEVLGRRPQGQKMRHFHLTKLGYLNRQVKAIPNAVRKQKRYLDHN